MYSSNPYESPLLAPSLPGQDILKSQWTPSTVASDSMGFLSTPPRHHIQLPSPLVPPPPPGASAPPVDYMFSMRELLLKFRTSMGNVPPPWELKLRYGLVSEQELYGSDDSMSTPKSPSAGQTLLAFAKGEASMSEVVGKAQGAELLQFITGADDKATSPTARKATGKDNVQHLLGLSSVQQNKGMPDRASKWSRSDQAPPPPPAPPWPPSEAAKQAEEWDYGRSQRAEQWDYGRSKGTWKGYGNSGGWNSVPRQDAHYYPEANYHEVQYPKGRWRS